MMQVFAVFDHKINKYLTPFFQPSNGAAIRLFADECGKGDTLLSNHPGDFSLHNLGEYNDDTGAIVSAVPPTLLGYGSEYAKAEVKSA